MTPDGSLTQLQRGKFGRPVPAIRAFSLLELLIVMALIVILFTIYWSGGSRGFQIRQIAKCDKNLQRIYSALTTYSVDNQERLPTLAGATTSEPVLSQLVPRCTTSTEIFICPGSKDSALPEAQPFAERKISYAYYMGRSLKDGASEPLLSDCQVNVNSKSQGQLLFSADGKMPGANHNKFGGNVLFCDGSVQSSGPSAAFTLSNALGVTLLNPRP